MAKIVLIASGKDADKASEALDGAGIDYEVVEPTPANLLHIVIGMVDDGEAPADEEEPADEPAPEDEAPADEAPADEPPADEEEEVTESLGTVRVDGEVIAARRGKNKTSILRSPSIQSGARTTYKLNEGTMTFWPANPSSPAVRVLVEGRVASCSVEVILQQAEGNDAYLLVGDDLASLFKTA